MIDRHNANSELFSQGVLTDSIFEFASYFHHLISRQLGVVMGFASWVALLAGHVLAVILIGSKKKMTRIAAWGIVAAMTDKQAFWNRSVVDYPGKTMGENALAMTGQIPVARFKCTASPHPATIWMRLIEALVESHFGCVLFVKVFQGGFLGPSTSIKGHVW